MSRKASYNPRKAAKAACGEHGFVPHTLELLQSKAWRSRSINLVRVLDRLELEHLAHAGKENGYLVVTYDQFEEYGAQRKRILEALTEGVELGLIEITHQGGFRGAARKDPSRYRLTYLSAKYQPVIGALESHTPTNDWQNYPSGTNADRRRKRSAFVASKIGLNGGKRGNNRVVHGGTMEHPTGKDSGPTHLRPNIPPSTTAIYTTGSIPSVMNGAGALRGQAAKRLSPSGNATLRGARISDEYAGDDDGRDPDSLNDVIELVVAQR